MPSQRMLGAVSFGYGASVSEAWQSGHRLLMTAYCGIGKLAGLAKLLTR